MLAQYIAGLAGFHFKDRRDRFYVVLYTVAVFINTLLDMWMVTILAMGFQLNQGFKSLERVSRTSGSVNSSPNLQNALYVQLMAYLYPGTLLLPFLIEPVVT